jgi:hypothetical protein
MEKNRSKEADSHSHSEEILNPSHGSRIIIAASVVQWSEFQATDPEIPGSIPSATRFSEK